MTLLLLPRCASKIILLLGAAARIHPLQFHRGIARLPEHFPAWREPSAHGFRLPVASHTSCARPVRARLLDGGIRELPRAFPARGHRADSKQARAVFAQSRGAQHSRAGASKVSIPFMMNRERIFIANLSKGRLGTDKAALLGSLLTTQFQLESARARAPRFFPLHRRVPQFHHRCVCLHSRRSPQVSPLPFSLTSIH